MSENQQTRREFIKKATYVAPVIFTLSVTPSIASSASKTSSKSGPTQVQLQRLDGTRESSKLERRYTLSKK